MFEFKIFRNKSYTHIDLDIVKNFKGVCMIFVDIVDSEFSNTLYEMISKFSDDDFYKFVYKYFDDTICARIRLDNYCILQKFMEEGYDKQDIWK